MRARNVSHGHVVQHNRGRQQRQHPKHSNTCRNTPPEHRSQSREGNECFRMERRLHQLVHEALSAPVTVALCHRLACSCCPLLVQPRIGLEWAREWHISFQTELASPCRCHAQFVSGICLLFDSTVMDLHISIRYWEMLKLSCQAAGFPHPPTT